MTSSPSVASHSTIPIGSSSRNGDGFRALAYIDGHHCRLVSRRGHVYKSWPYLATELAHAVALPIGGPRRRDRVPRRRPAELPQAPIQARLALGSTRSIARAR